MSNLLIYTLGILFWLLAPVFCLALIWINYVIVDFFLWRLLLRRKKSLATLVLLPTIFALVTLDVNWLNRYRNPPPEYFKSGIERYVPVEGASTGELVSSYRSDQDFTGDFYWCVVLKFDLEQYQTLKGDLQQYTGKTLESINRKDGCDDPHKNSNPEHVYNYQLHVDKSENNSWKYYQIRFSEEDQQIYFYFTT